MLTITDLHASVHDTPILKGINFSVLPKEIHLILGLNGSGKSTFGKVLLGSHEYMVDQGSITFEGEDITQIPTFLRAQKGIFLSHQMPPAIEGVSAKELLRASEKEHSSSQKRSILQFKKELTLYLQTMGLDKTFLERSMNVGASGGERKKMEMASLLMMPYKLAFLDEIDSGVDIDAIKAIAKGIDEFLKKPNTAAIIVSHSDALLKYIQPTHVHIFSNGTIIQSGDATLAKNIHTHGFSYDIS